MSPFNTVTLDVTGTTKLADAGQNAGPEGWLVLVRSTAWVGSLVFKSNQAPPGAAQNLVNVAYQTGGTWATVSAGTAITANGSIVVSQTGYDLYVTETHTSGAVSLDLFPINIGSSSGGGGAVSAIDITAGTFGAASGETGTYTFPGALTATGLLTASASATITGAVTFTTKLVSTTALATPSALTATALNAFASTVSGATLMGFGTTHDVALKNQGGTTVAGVVQNATTFAVVGLLTVSATANITGALTFTTSLSSTTALATPSALTATQFTGFASTVSGAAIMGFGTTYDVAVMQKSGAVAAGVPTGTTNWTVIGNVITAAGKVQLGAAPDTSAAININSDTYADALMSFKDTANSVTITLAQRTDGNGTTFSNTTNGVTFSLFRNQVAGATTTATLNFEALTSTSASWSPGSIAVLVLDDTNGSMDSEMLFQGYIAGAQSYPMHLGPTASVMARFYNPAVTYPSNWEAIEIRYDSNVARIFSTATGTGTARELQVGHASAPWGYTSAGVLYPTGTDNTFDIGTTSKRVQKAYVGTRLVLGNATSEDGLIWVRTSGGVNAFTINATTGRVTVGEGITVTGAVTAAAAVATAANITLAATAAANSDVLRGGLVTMGAGTPGSFTGLQAIGWDIAAFSTAGFTSPGDPVGLRIGIITGSGITANAANAIGISIAPPTGATANYLIAHTTVATFNVTAAGAMTLAGLITGGAGATITGAISATTTLKAGSGTAITAGGSLSGVLVSSAGNFGVFVGSGAPTISALKGSLYLRSDGTGVADRAYVNTDGGTTWTAITTIA